MLSIRMITQFVLDPFHLVLKGVIKRFMIFVMRGTKSGMRLTAVQIVEITNGMQNLRAFIPSEFSRKPRKTGLKELGKWKRTECRLFLLYIGCIVLKNIIAPTLYKLFLMLQCAITVLSTSCFIEDEFIIFNIC